MPRPTPSPTRPLRIRARRAGAAFTLIELMVVMGLLAIVTAMILPEMRGTYRDALLRSSSRELVDACGLAASRAVSLGQSHRIRIDPATGRFRLERESSSLDPSTPFVPVTEIPRASGQIDARIAVQFRRPGIESDGQPHDEPDSDRFASQPSDREVDGPAEPGPFRGATFYPDGTADRVEFRLRDPDGFGLALRVNPVTARIRVVPLERP